MPYGPRFRPSEIEPVPVSTKGFNRYRKFDQGEVK